ncbi:MAG: MCP four helix bundle domain-containing protein, partial [Synergistaceae bacterium]|nr:MCP four helix bundle domain-containing protein [Synergistaceae bacterium]
MPVMQWFKNFSTTTKTFTLVFTMVFLLSVVAFTGYSTCGTVIDIMNSMFLDYVRPAIGMGEMKSMAIQNRRMILTMAVVDDKQQIADYERRILENRKVIADTFDRYENVVTQADEKAMFKELRNLRTKLL